MAHCAILFFVRLAWAMTRMWKSSSEVDSTNRWSKATGLV
jgi:hypothetical protein